MAAARLTSVAPVVATAAGEIVTYSVELQGRKQQAETVTFAANASLELVVKDWNSKAKRTQAYVSDATGLERPDAKHLSVRVKDAGRIETAVILEADSVGRFGGPLPKTVNGFKQAERWRRLVVKCRQAVPPAPPAVKLIVPLTQTRGTDEKIPGWMVVLEEPWQQYAGLAEAFVASVEKVQSFTTKKDGTIEPKEFVEVGPDPIETLTAPPVLATGAAKLKFTPVGPIGYTFDTDTEAPLFLRAAFFLPAPRIDGIEPQALGNFFFKLAFQRTVVDGSMAPSLPDTMASAPTEPQEAQLLTPSTFWDTDQGRLHVSEFRYDGARKQFFRPDNPNKPLEIRGSSTNQSTFNALDVLMLLKDPVTDAFGRSDQEMVVGDTLYQIGKAETPVATYAHLVELQRPTAKTPQHLETDLFPGTAEDNSLDAHRRIVRVSPRIEPL